MEDDLVEAGELGREFFPEPAGHELDGGIFEAGDVVEIMVVELGDDGAHGLGNSRVVVEDAGLFVDGAAHGDGDLEAVAMNVAALVAGGKLGQGLGRFELEILGDDDGHAGDSRSV